MSAIPPPPTGHVVVGVDGSSAALSAVTQAALEAANRHLPLEIVSAWTLPDDGQLDAYVMQMRREAEEATKAAVAHARALHPQIWTIARVRRGPAHEVLLASAEHACLVVLGSRGHGRMAGLLLGSVSLSVAAYTPCPLLVVRDRHEVASRAHGFGEGLVVVGVEGSDCGPAVEAAYEEAQLRHLRVCALNAIPPVVREGASQALVEASGEADLVVPGRDPGRSSPMPRGRPLFRCRGFVRFTGNVPAATGCWTRSFGPVGPGAAAGITGD
ncbi:universal stress protein [Embleya sp. NPDC020630]|uniref:universal stress protein n=1 Tax=Embleya sp. NPDC020630 TaxID=3363979 RepID=UPI0037BC8CF8